MPYQPSAARIEADLRYLTETIGVRLAGSDNERRAAEFIADRFAGLDLDCRIESFPVRSRCVKKEELEIRACGKWHRVPASLFGAAPGTGGKALTAELVIFAPAVDFRRPDLGYLRDKAVLLLGTHIEQPQDYARLLAAKPRFLMMTDTRYPADRPMADGLFPAYVARYGAIPTVNVPYLTLWELCVAGADRARLRVAGGPEAAESQNVIGEIPGTHPDEPVLYLGSHHDTQAGSVGADDNGSGVAAILEAARLLAGRKYRRTIRLISFGTEEQLSVGSAVYVRRHRKELAAGGFMFNLDAMGSFLGWNTVALHADDRAERYLGKVAAEYGYLAKVSTALSPYGDHFPFVAAGVPALWAGRVNCDCGRFFHHRADDDLSNVSCEVIAQAAAVAAAFTAQAAAARELPFAPRVSPELAKSAAVAWRDLFGGWKGF